MRFQFLAVMLMLVILAGCSDSEPVQDIDRDISGERFSRPAKIDPIPKKQATPLVETEPEKAQEKPQQWQTVKRVIDGDTLVLQSAYGEEKVRLIGVDTPETVDPRKPVERFGKEASEFTRKLVEGKKVWLEYDQTRTDKYLRTLAYVHMADDRVLNEEIIRYGYGHAYTEYPFKYMNKYRDLERQAGDILVFTQDVEEMPKLVGNANTRLGQVACQLLTVVGGQEPLRKQRLVARLRQRGHS